MILASKLQINFLIKKYKINLPILIINVAHLTQQQKESFLRLKLDSVLSEDLNLSTPRRREGALRVEPRSRVN